MLILFYLDGVESEVLERGLETDPRGKVGLRDCAITHYSSRGANSDEISVFSSS